jgi:hypothetical protein
MPMAWPVDPSKTGTLNPNFELEPVTQIKQGPWQGHRGVRSCSSGRRRAQNQDRRERLSSIGPLQ